MNPAQVESGLFRDRHEAGRVLAQKLQDCANRQDVLVLALPRGGVPVAYEVARALRATPGGKRITLVAVTGYGQAEDRQRSKEAGFDAHLVKPVSQALLSRLI